MALSSSPHCESSELGHLRPSLGRGVLAVAMATTAGPLGRLFGLLRSQFRLGDYERFEYASGGLLYVRTNHGGHLHHIYRFTFREVR